MDFDGLDLDGLEMLANDSGTEVLYDEVEMIEAGGFALHILFWPKGEIALGFQEVEWERTNCP